MPLTTYEAQIEKIVEQVTLLRQNLQNMVTVLTPVGVVQAFSGSTTPDGWLLCDGSAVNREDYAALFAVIGETYGAGDGSTTFNLPDLTDRFVQGNATAGTVKQAGIPNIVGTFNAPASYDPTGAFSKEKTFTNKFYVTSTYATDYINVEFDASKYSNLYGNSDTVQPPSLTMRYIIKY